MSVEWFRVNTGLLSHPKFRCLRSKIGPVAAECLLALWAWAAQARRNGILQDAGEAEIAAGWAGAQGALHAALVSVGFIEADGVTLHDWMHHNGKYIESMMKKREQTAERVRRHRSLPPAPPSTDEPTPTPTATATGNALRNAPCNALQDEVRARGARPTTGEYTTAWLEYRMCGGLDGEEAFAKWMRACEAKGLTVAQVMAWLRDNPGSHVHEARDALVAPVARPARPAAGQDFSGI